MRTLCFRHLLLKKLSLVPALLVLGLATACSQAPPYDPIQDWGIESGFVIAVDSEGFSLPTAIALVPNPGDASYDPIYFVTELQGKVKVVTNDRSIHTFAENFFDLEPTAKLPAAAGEVGLAGICLDPARGYVFVTFAYDDANGILRNNIMRFETTPRTFSKEPVGKISFTDVFSGDEATPSHQIGACQVDGDLLFVGVADGGKPAFSQITDSTLGKIIRMTLDGNPVADNPFYEIGDNANPSDYVWAMGLRNPFGLKTLDGRVFVADNGPLLDRFLEARAGNDYLWDGSDASIGTNAELVLSPSLGVVQMDHYPDGSSLFPERFRRSFFLTRSGNLPMTEEPSSRHPPDILTIEFSLEGNRLLNTPKRFLQYRGTQDQMLVGLGFGPTGLYFVPLYPDEKGISAVYKVTYQAGQAGSLTRSGFEIMGQKGCFACHNLRGTGGSVGPVLDRQALVQRIETRLESPEYKQRLEGIDQLDREPFKSFRAARKEVLSSEGLEQVRAWIEYQIQEPKFDDPDAVMPNLAVSKQESALIADFLLTPVGSKGFIRQLVERGGDLLPHPRKRHLVSFFAGGFILGGLAFALSYAVLRALQRNRRSKSIDD